MAVILVLIPEWETCSLVLEVPPGTPAVIVEKGRVKTATLRAQRNGVEKGMKLNYAQYLCPELLVMPADENRTQRAFNFVMEALEEVTPFAQVIRPGLALLPAPKEIKNLSNQAKPLADFLNQIVDSIALSTQAEAYVAAGETCLEAWVKLNNYLPEQPHYPTVESFPLLGLTELFPKSAPEIAKMLQELTYLGVETIAEVQTLGWDTLQTRFGLAAHQLKQLVANGNIATTTSKAELELSIEMEFPVLLQDPLLVVGQILDQAQQLIQKMQAKQVSAQAINIQAQLQIPREITDEIDRTYLETQLIQIERSWALFNLPNATDITTRIEWQLQAWLQQYQNQTARQLNSANYQTYYESEFYTQIFGIKQLKVTATGLIPIGETIQKLWGNKTASDLRAVRAAEKIQQKLGDGKTHQISITPGWDPLSRVKTRAWGEKIRKTPWEEWTPHRKWRNHPNYQTTQTWQGSFNLPAPSTVFQPSLAVQLSDALAQPVEVTETGLLTAVPTHLHLSAKTRAYLQNQRFHWPKTLCVTAVIGPWIHLGKWWENERKTGKVWLKITVEIPLEPADAYTESVPPQQLLIVYEQRQWRLGGIW
ncbi:MAG: hypothetical protein Q4D73_05295 [Actinomycetaceae bacterium]|nr:hypothetical protein [Actinomycetaceae bacterium]